MLYNLLLLSVKTQTTTGGYKPLKSQKINTHEKFQIPFFDSWMYISN